MAKLVTSAVLCVLIFSGTLTLVTAQSADIQSKINAHNAQIEALEKEIAQYERELTSVSASKRTLEGTVKELDISRKKVVATISVEEKQINRTEAQIEEIDTTIGTKKRDIQKNTEAIAATLRRLNASENETAVETILNSGSLGDVWDNFDTEQQFQLALQDKVGILSNDKTVLEKNLEASNQKHKELLQRKQNLLAQRQALDVTKKEKDQLLTSTKQQETSYQKLLNEKKAAKEAFENALNELESQLAYSVDPNRLPPAGKGVLRWPLDNVTITQKFGHTDFAKSGAYNGQGHNGVDFRASVGTSVKSALSGTVTGTGNTDAYPGCYSYGKWVLVRHANGLSTLYAHLSSILVDQGQAVDTGQVIGLSGNTGYSTGPHLHFTLYASEAVQIRKLGDLKTKTNCAQAAIPVAALEAYLNPLEYL